MIIETICAYPQSVVYGTIGLVGAGIMSAKTISEKKKELGDEFKLDYTKIADTTWQSVLAGIAAGSAMTCGYPSLVTAAVAAYGADKLANKVKPFGITPANLISIVSTFLTRADKKVSGMKKTSGTVKKKKK